MALEEHAQQAIEVLGKDETIQRLKELISSSARYLWLVSPYVSLGKLRDISRALLAARQRGVKVTLVVRAKDSSVGRADDIDLATLEELGRVGVEIKEVRDLHAKLYISEKHAIVTSLNLLESSFNNSIEVGVWIPGSSSEYATLGRFFSRELRPHLQDKAIQKKPAKKMEERRSSKKRDFFEFEDNEEDEEGSEDFGHCIRCGDEIPLDPARPYCNEDYAAWSKYRNPDYEDRFCHGCGKKHPATMAKPLCRDCYKTIL